MVDEPFYEFFPYRLRLSGREAITELWSRIFAEAGWIRCFSADVRVPVRVRCTVTRARTRWSI